jgi:hypothetical protein
VNRREFLRTVTGAAASKALAPLAALASPGTAFLFEPLDTLDPLLAQPLAWANNGAPTPSGWENKTAAQILAEINAILAECDVRFD